MHRITTALAILAVSVCTALAVTNFPGGVDGIPVFGTAMHGAPVAKETINNLRDAIIATETKVGEDGSADTTTLDYLLKNPASVDPGHTHTGASISAIDAASITTGTLADARLSANVAFKNVTNTFTLVQNFSAGIAVTGTVTATTFSGSGASLTNIPETAITNGAILARVGDNETITGNWSFSGTLTASGANITNIPEANITDGTLLARVADNETITGTWSFVGNIAKIRNVTYVWPAANASGVLQNDGAGNLSWSAAASVTPGGASGAVQFNNSSAFGGDTTNFFWDNTNKRLGLGTNTPNTRLEVSGTIRSSAIAGGGSQCLQANNNGDITAIGASCASLTTSPAGGTGDIQFNTGGAFAADTGQLFWDATNNRLGIGTNTPATVIDTTTGSITSGHHFVTTHNTYDLGTLAASWRTGYFATSVVTPLVTFGNNFSITTTASNGNITFIPNGTGKVFSTIDGNTAEILGSIDNITTSSTVNNTAAETDVNTFTLTSGFGPPAGRMYHLHVGGTVRVGTGGADTAEYRVYIGGTMVCDSTALNPGPTTAVTYYGDVDLTVRTAGSSAVVQCNGVLSFGDTITGGPSHNDQIIFNTNTTTIDLDGTPAIVIKNTIQFSSADPTNEIVESQYHLDAE